MDEELVKELNKNLRTLIRLKSYGRVFLSGMVSGLGSILGATILLTIVVLILSKLNFLPFVRYILEYLPKK